MQCRTCRTALQPGAVFCSNCGTPAQAAPSPPPVVIKSAGNAPGGAPAPIPAAAQQLYAVLPQHQPRGQTWSTFLHTQAQQIWACDFLPVTDLFFRSLFAFFN